MHPLLASGVDPLAGVGSSTQLRQAVRHLKEGKGVVDEAAKDFVEIIQMGWTGQLVTVSSIRYFGGHCREQQLCF